MTKQILCLAFLLVFTPGLANSQPLASTGVSSTAFLPPPNSQHLDVIQAPMNGIPNDINLLVSEAVPVLETIPVLQAIGSVAPPRHKNVGNQAGK